jgi:tight adherence protein B
MPSPLMLLAIALCLAAAAWWLRQLAARLAARDLLQRHPEASLARAAPQRSVPRSAIGRYRLLPPLAAAALGSLLHWVWGWSWLYAGTAALIAALLAAQGEAYWAARRAARLQQQLADAIDLIVASLGAGTSLLAALETAARESPAPLRSLLEELLARIRYGDDPQQAFQNLARRVPLDTFVLFATALSVHWDVGGSLTMALATVGRTVRDRIEVARRIQANVVQSQVATVAVLVLTYFVAAVVWRSNPEQMSAFLRSQTGGYFAAASMVLQAVGIVWMSRLSRLPF